MDWAKVYITTAGVFGVGTGVLGFIGNPFVAEPVHDPIFATDAVHNLIHIATGILALWIGLGTTGERQARGIISFGILYLVLFATLVVSPDLFGVLRVDVNNADHVLHAALGVATLCVGLAAQRKAGRALQRHPLIR
jgi:hypothetical protein